jgi:argininosuccinate lyase
MLFKLKSFHFLFFPAFSYAWSLWSDVQRLIQLRDRVNVMPLGSGALAGSPFPIDRLYLSDLLGFDNITPNSLLGVGDRDFVGMDFID